MVSQTEPLRREAGADVVLRNAVLATMAPDRSGYGLVDHGALAIRDATIAWVGPDDELPSTLVDGAEIVDAAGRCVTPGLIDPHTHLIYGGNRAHEWEQRLEGASYEAIARAGGGIASTVAATRAADELQLLHTAERRLSRMCADGVTTVEIKSGYGLDAPTEMKMLRVARRLETLLPVDVRTTFLGAHAVPPEYAGRADEYVSFLCESLLPQLAAEGLVDAVDAFCETIAFSADQTARVFDAAQRLGIPVKLHADQRSDSGGAALAARYHALSADHLEHTSAAGLDALAAAGTVAVILPGAYYVLREQTAPPIDELRKRNIPMAIATDANPGTSPLLSPLLAMHLACTLFGFTPAEALAGMTRNAARALGLSDRGAIAVGMRADIVVWDVERPAEILYTLGDSPRTTTYRAGRRVRFTAI